jgi:hypothetical protein
MTGISDDHGWIHLHRKIQFNFLWTEPRVFSKAEAWIDMLMEARYSENPAQMLIGSHLIECCQGQCIKSLDTWAARWHWNKSKVRRFFDLLQRVNQIRLENVTKTTRITICNYETYNLTRPENETILKRTCNALETHLTPNKKERREEGKKEKKATSLTCPGQAPDSSVVLLPFNSPAFLESWNGYVDHRKKIKAPMTDRAKNLALNKLPKSEAEAIRWIDNATEKGWRGIYDPNNGKQTAKPPQSQADQEHNQRLHEKLLALTGAGA